jgi:hypothetical protein
MTPTQVKKQLQIVYSLISQDDYLSALKMSYEMLVSIASYENGINSTKYESLNKFEVLKLLFDFLSKRSFKDIEFLFLDLCVLSVYYENTNRNKNPEELMPRIGLLVSKIVGVIECNLLERPNGLYSVDSFENALIDYDNLFSDEISQMKAKILSYYYYIEAKYTKMFRVSFWNDDINNLDFIFGDTLNWIQYISQEIENALLSNNLDVLKILIENIDSYEVSEIFDNEISKNKNMMQVCSEIDDFIVKESLIGKNVFKEGGNEKEATFHKMLFIYLGKNRNNDEVLMSEIPLERNRFDIVWNNLSTKLSTIIELKVNDLGSFIKDIQQVERYLSSNSDVVFFRKPDFGVLFTYCISKREEEYRKQKLDEAGYAYEEIGDSIVIKSTEKPIIIKTIFNPFAE